MMSNKKPGGSARPPLSTPSPTGKGTWVWVSTCSRCAALPLVDRFLPGRADTFFCVCLYYYSMPDPTFLSCVRRARRWE